MQFLEHSFIGLRAARHALTHPERDVTITLFPMVHLGEPAFYKTVYEDASRYDAVLLEGVTSRVVRRLTRAYRWAAPERLGLTVQPKFKADATRVIHADLSGSDFDALWRAAPRVERWLFEGAATLIGLWLRITATRDTLARGLCTNDLSERDDILIWSQRRAPILTALKDARDKVLCQRLADLMSEQPGPATIAVIYGAGHFPALVRSLDADGFRVSQSQWLTVFEL
ncbi:MAG: hypothetical protein AAF922_18315 [Pseudomonadota bacterium]